MTNPVYNTSNTEKNKQLLQSMRPGSGRRLKEDFSIVNIADLFTLDNDDNLAIRVLLNGGNATLNNLLITGDLVVEGDFNFGDVATDKLTIAGYIQGSNSGKKYVAIGNAVTSHSLLGNDDLVVKGFIEVDKMAYLDGGLTTITGLFSGQISSSLVTGTAPLVIASTTKVDNLNADLVDGVNIATLTDGRLTRYNSTGTQIENATVTESSGALGGITTLSMSGQLTNSVADGTTPMLITSKTVVANFNADLLDGQDGSFYQNASNINAGTLADTYLSNNVFLLNANNTLTGSLTLPLTETPNTSILFSDAGTIKGTTNVIWDKTNKIFAINPLDTATISNTTFNSTELRLSGSAWDTDDNVARTVGFKQQVIVSSGTNPGADWRLTLQRDGVDFSANLQFLVNGTLRASGIVRSAIGVFDSASGGTTMNNRAVDGATAVGHIINSENALMTTGAKLLSVRNATVEKFNIGFDGATTLDRNMAATIGTTVYNSADFKLVGSAWDTDDAVSVKSGFRQYVIPSSSTSVGATWYLAFQRDGVDVSGINLQFISNGTLRTSGGVRSAIGLFDSVNTGITLLNRVADGATAVGQIINSENALTTAGAKLLSIRNSGEEKLSVGIDGSTLLDNKDTATVGAPVFNSPLVRLNGNAWDIPTGTSKKTGVAMVFVPTSVSGGVFGSLSFRHYRDDALVSTMATLSAGGTFSSTGNVFSGGGIFGSSAGATTLQLLSGRTDSSTSVAHIIDTSNAFTTNGAKLLSIRNATVEKFFVDKDGTFYNAGGRIESITSVTDTTYSLLTNDRNLLVTYTATGAVTITLPTAQVVAGRVIDIKDAGFNATTNNITITCEGAGTKIENSTDDLIINTSGDSVVLISDGTDWFIK